MQPPGSDRSMPTAPRGPEHRETMLSMMADLVVKAAQEQDQRLLEFYLGSAESGGYPREEVLQEALQQRPDDPMLLALAGNYQS